ncbi:hypothetical protein [Butyrivibrio sp. WCD3002]|uniref:hypothetical protein n=1 Tax=Butyrivibrio sp. WCD3002 TaxID=1280676 RepID=UPI00040078CF|nr:hypothetical protein [Butyrivibrio sp. WCD3002]
MNEDFNYLSDEELEKLISSTEESSMVQAPPDFEESVLKVISFQARKREYARFRFQVCMAMAAAILFMFLIPAISNSSGVATIRERSSQAAEENDSNTKTGYVSELLGKHSFSDAVSSFEIGNN